MSRESSIVAKIRQRVARKKAELDTVESELATLLVRKVALESGIAEDEDLISKAAPKTPRVRKMTTPRTEAAQI